MLREIELERNEHFEPLINPGQVTGFQSPAQDYETDRLNVINKLVKDPLNTFYFISDDDSMIHFSIRKGSILVVDKSIIPLGGMRVVFFHESRWLVRQLVTHGMRRILTTGDQSDVPLEIKEDGVRIWGVVTWSCCPQMEVKKHVRPGRLQ